MATLYALMYAEYYNIGKDKGPCTKQIQYKCFTKFESSFKWDFIYSMWPVLTQVALLKVDMIYYTDDKTARVTPSILIWLTVWLLTLDLPEVYAWVDISFIKKSKMYIRSLHYGTPLSTPTNS